MAARKNQRPPLAVLESVHLVKLLFDQALPSPKKGSVKIQNRVALDAFDEEKKAFRIRLTIEAIGFSDDNPDMDDKQKVFQAVSEWTGGFSLKRKSSEAIIKGHSEHYSMLIFPLARMFVVETLNKAGINLELMPWEVNPSETQQTQGHNT